VSARGILLVALFAARAAAQEVPRLVFDPLPGASPSVARLGRSDPERLRSAMELVGLTDPGLPIHVLLAPEGSLPARDVPPWISGYTDGVSGLVVLLPARTPVYPDDGLAEVLDHEVAHVLVARASGGHTVPRWFNEGLALVAERSFGMRDRPMLSLRLLLTGRVSLDRLSELFGGEAGDAREAYAFSLALVTDLLERHGRGLPRAIFLRMREGEPFEAAFRDVTGRTLAEADASFWERQRDLTRWLPLVTSGTALWLVILALSLVAWIRRRNQAREKREAWAAAEAEEEAENLPVM
jgi:hypothetical protein